MKINNKNKLKINLIIKKYRISDTTNDVTLSLKNIPQFIKKRQDTFNPSINHILYCYLTVNPKNVL